MKVALTGATGFIGSHVLTELQANGHEVTALVRAAVDADALESRGAVPSVVDLYDRPAVGRLLREADGAIHVASPGDATSADLDSAVVDAAIDAFAGTGKPYLHIIGPVDLRIQLRHRRGVSDRCARDRRVEGGARPPDPRRRRACVAS